MRKEHKKPITNIYTREIYKLDSQLISKKKVKKMKEIMGVIMAIKIIIFFLPIIVPITK